MAPVIFPSTATRASLTRWITSFIRLPAALGLSNLFAYVMSLHVIVSGGELMARGRNTKDLTTLQMALVGYQIEKQKIEDKIRQIQGQLKGRRVVLPSDSAANSGGGRKRVLSAAARRRIAAAQKKRWAEHRKRAAAAKQA